MRRRDEEGPTDEEIKLHNQNVVHARLTGHPLPGMTYPSGPLISRRYDVRAEVNRIERQAEDFARLEFADNYPNPGRTPEERDCYKLTSSGAGGYRWEKIKLLPEERPVTVFDSVLGREITVPGTWKLMIDPENGGKMRYVPPETRLASQRQVLGEERPDQPSGFLMIGHHLISDMELYLPEGRPMHAGFFPREKTLPVKKPSKPAQDPCPPPPSFPEGWPNLHKKK